MRETGFCTSPRDCNGFISAARYAQEIGLRLAYCISVPIPRRRKTLSDESSLTYAYYFKHTKPAPPKTKTKGYRCKICGFVYEGEPLPDDYICPICKHPASDFEKIE